MARTKRLKYYWSRGRRVEIREDGQPLEDALVIGRRSVAAGWTCDGRWRRKGAHVRIRACRSPTTLLTLGVAILPAGAFGTIGIRRRDPATGAWGEPSILGRVSGSVRWTMDELEAQASRILSL